jgi:hypothetical protein
MRNQGPGQRRHHTQKPKRKVKLTRRRRRPPSKSCVWSLSRTVKRRHRGAGQLPDEQVVRTTVGRLAADLAGTGATMAVLVLVGEALGDGPDTRRSHLYEPALSPPPLNQLARPVLSGVQVGGDCLPLWS